MLTQEQRQILVRATYDSSEGVWTAVSDDVPGLAADAWTFEALAFDLDSLIPELLTLNNVSRTNEGDLVYGIEVKLVRTIPRTT